MKCKSLFLGILCLLFLGGLRAQDKKSYSLKEAQDYALQNSPTAKQSTLSVDQSRKRVNEITAIGLPQVAGSLGYQNFIKQPVQLIPSEFVNPNAEPGTFEEVVFGTKQNASVDLTVNQLIFDGSYIVGLQAARTYVLLAQNQDEKSQIDVMQMVREAYHTVLVAEENLEVLKKSKTSITKLVSETQALYDNGFAEEQDVDQLKLTESRINNNIRNAERQVGIAKNLLKYQMGLDLKIEIDLSDDINSLLSVPQGEDFLNKDFNAANHIDYKIVGTSVKLNELALKNERAKYLPSLGGYFNWQENSFSNDNTFVGDGAQWFPTRVWGLQLNVPIFTSFQRRSIVAQAQIDLEKSQLQLNQVEQGLQLQVQTARSNYAMAVETYRTEKSNMELAEKIYNRTRTKYKEGLATSFELTQSENQWLESQGSYINSMLQLLNAKSE
ncbi:MAG: TolC family protein [Salibacteraceae bacterium]